MKCFGNLAITDEGKCALIVFEELPLILDTDWLGSVAPRLTQRAGPQIPSRIKQDARSTRPCSSRATRVLLEGMRGLLPSDNGIGPLSGMVPGSWWYATRREGLFKCRRRDLRSRDDSNGSVGPPAVIAKTDISRSSGFPRMARLGSEVHFAWTEFGKPRVLGWPPLISARTSKTQLIKMLA